LFGRLADAAGHPAAAIAAAAGRGHGANALRQLGALGEAQRRAVRIVARLPLRRLGLALLGGLDLLFRDLALAHSHSPPPDPVICTTQT
jgi:hypothetical protein